MISEQMNHRQLGLGFPSVGTDWPRSSSVIVKSMLLMFVSLTAKRKRFRNTFLPTAFALFNDSPFSKDSRNYFKP